MIFRRIRNLFARRRQRAEREIFRYWDGTRERGIDPIHALREMMRDEQFNAEHDLQAAIDGNETATSNCIAVARRTFGLPEWCELDGEESGLTDMEALTLLFTFGDFMDSVKKNSNGPPTLPVATEPPHLAKSTTNAE